jgi:hypothetical protein
VIYDPADMSLNSHTIYFTDQQDLRSEVRYLLFGKLKCADPNAPTFKDLATYSAYAKEPALIPYYIDPETSFVLRKADMDLCNKYLTKINQKEPQTYKYEPIHNWKQLAGRLEDLEVAMMTNKQLSP